MERYKKVCGVSLDLENLPSKEDFIKTAMVNKQNESNPNALKDIEKELKLNGLYSTNTSEPKEPKPRK